ncbi:MAG: MFS transporter, partial [Acidimicrobiales bacterium]
MTATAPESRAVGASSRGRWIDHWDPEDEAFWEATGKKIAKKNLILSMFAEHVGFSIW